MSYQRISKGSPLLLRLQTGDGATGKYPLAHVYDSSHAEVAGSPFSLSHIGNGLYANESYVTTTVDHFDASYTVFSDVGHTTVDTTYNYDTDSFDSYVLGTGGGSGSSSPCGMTVAMLSSQLNITLNSSDLQIDLEDSELLITLAQVNSLTVQLQSAKETVLLSASDLTTLISSDSLMTNLEASELNANVASDSLTVIFQCND